MIRVMLADDHVLVREGLVKLLGNTADLEVVGAAGNGAEAVGMARAAQPDVILMDISMPVVDGIEATRRILLEQPEARVVILTSFSERERILDAIDAGAVGYLLKDSEPEELVKGVRAAARGESPLAAKAATAVLGARARASSPELTAREREVLTLVAGGMANKLIARDLGISEKTVKAHLTNVFQRIGVQDRTQAALWAQRNGIAV
ncbi:MAG TPA: response regulator transcription factor [Acidimicrobiales bacterium]|nr:response regulator transcription factor [Acidimicrobiales bacterium]